MANHSNIKTKKHMSEDSINLLLRRLEDQVFFNTVGFEMDPTDGEPYWDVCLSNRSILGSSFWLNTRQNIEIRHSSPSFFLWWVQFYITDQIAERFDGHIIDDGRVLKSFDTPNNYYDYTKKCCERYTNPLSRFVMQKWYLSDCPKEYKKAYKENKKGSMV